AFLGYEAIAIKRAGPCHAFGKDYLPRELYPCNEDWGKLAISVSDLDRAMDAAKDFSQRAKKREDTRDKGPTESIRQPQKSGTHRSASVSSVDTQQFPD